MKRFFMVKITKKWYYIFGVLERSYMKKSGFTLAETLIVTSVLGVMAAFLLMSSGGKIDKQKILFHKGYQTAERIITELVNDETLYSYDPASPGLRNKTEATWPGTNETFEGDSKLCRLFSKKLGIEPKANCGWITAADGISYYVEKVPFEGGYGYDDSAVIFIDTDGREKGANCANPSSATRHSDMVTSKHFHSCALEEKQDIFTIEAYYDGTIRIENDPKAVALVEKERIIEEEQTSSIKSSNKTK